MIQQNKFELIWSCILKVMIFTILENFSGIFLILFKCIFDFSVFKLIEIKAKRVHISREPTWMRHGMQGHVAEPRGPVRVPAWH